MSTSYTQEDLDAIEDAIAKGARRVKYTDKEIEYRSLKEMMEIRDFIKRCLSGSTSGARRVAAFSKGLC